jgi:hypothetical protein
MPPNQPGRIVTVDSPDLAIVLDQRATAPAWSAFTVVDDRDTTIEADPDTHKQRWERWLYWGNLVQFLDFGAGDSGQLALSRLDEFDADGLAVAGGAGVLTMLSQIPLDDDLDDDTLPIVHRPAAAAAAGDVVTSVQWKALLDMVDAGESGLPELVTALAEREAFIPEVGYELGDHAWQAELAWPDAQVAVVLAEDGGALDAYRQAGWQARSAADWPVDELCEVIGIAG